MYTTIVTDHHRTCLATTAQDWRFRMKPAHTQRHLPRAGIIIGCNQDATPIEVLTMCSATTTTITDQMRQEFRRCRRGTRGLHVNAPRVRVWAGRFGYTMERIGGGK